MRNKYPGICYRCNKRVEVGEGHFERFKNGWRTQHATCAIENRGIPDPKRAAYNVQKWIIVASGTGKKAQKARRRLRGLDGGSRSLDVLSETCKKTPT